MTSDQKSRSYAAIDRYGCVLFANAASSAFILLGPSIHTPSFRHFRQMSQCQLQ